jgi:phage shock protein C
MNCASCGNAVNSDARFCSTCGQAVASANMPPLAPPYAEMPPLVRPQFGRVIAGVCLGFAQHFGWDVVLVRLLAVVVVLLGFGSPILAYAIAWVVMPEGPYFVPQPVVPVCPPQNTTMDGSQTVSPS